LRLDQLSLALHLEIVGTESRDPVSGAQQVDNTAFGLCHVLDVRNLEQDRIVVIDIQQATHGRGQRHKHLAVLVCIVETLSAFGQHPDDHERHAVDEQTFPDRLRIAEQVACGRMAKHSNAGRTPDIVAAEKIAVGKFPGLHREIIRLDADNRRDLR